MNFSQAVSSGFNRYFEFSGRSARSEYWWWTLFVVLVNVTFNMLMSAGLSDSAQMIVVAVVLVFSVATLVPGLAVSIRRLHDVGRSGWWMLLLLIPLIGMLVLLYFAVQPSEGRTNDWGPVPEGARITVPT